MKLKMKTKQKDTHFLIFFFTCLFWKSCIDFIQWTGSKVALKYSSTLVIIWQKCSINTGAVIKGRPQSST